MAVIDEIKQIKETGTKEEKIKLAKLIKQISKNNDLNLLAENDYQVPKIKEFAEKLNEAKDEDIYKNLATEEEQKLAREGNLRTLNYMFNGQKYKENQKYLEDVKEGGIRIEPSINVTKNSTQEELERLTDPKRITKNDILNSEVKQKNAKDFKDFLTKAAINQIKQEKENTLKSLFTGTASSTITAPIDTTNFFYMLGETGGYLTATAKKAIEDWLSNSKDKKQETLEELVKKYGKDLSQEKQQKLLTKLKAIQESFTNAKKEGFLDATTDIMNNPFTKASNAIDEKVRDIVGAKQFEDETDSERAAYIAGTLINPLSYVRTAGTVGKYVPLIGKQLNKLNTAVDTVTNLTQKGVTKLATKAGEKATQKAINTGKTIEEAAKIGEKRTQQVANELNFAKNLFVPGVQITKDASLAQKGVELATQTAPAVGMFEIQQKFEGRKGLFGDYSKTEVDNENELSGWEKTAIGLGLISSSVVGIRGFNKLRNRLKGKNAVPDLGQEIVNESINNDLNPQYHNINNQISAEQSTMDKVATQIIDKNRPADILVDKEVMTPQQKAQLYINPQTKAKSAYTTGIISDLDGEDYQMQVVPETFTLKLENLKKTSPELSKSLEDYLDTSAQIELANSNFAKLLQNEQLNDSRSVELKLKELNSKNITPKNIPELQKQDLGAIGKFEKLPTYTSYMALKKKADILFSKLLQNPQTAEILSDMHKIESDLFNIFEKTGYYDSKSLQTLKKNRTMFHTVLNNKTGVKEEIGSFVYKPMEEMPKPKSFWQKTGEFFYKKDKPQTPEDLKIRGEYKNYTSINDETEERSFKYKPFEQTFYDNFTDTITKLLENNKAKDSVSVMMTEQSKKFNTILDKGNTDNLKQINKELDNFTFVKPIGKVKLSDESFVAPRDFYSIINRKENIENSKSLTSTMFVDRFEDQNKLSKLYSNYTQGINNKGIVSYVQDGYVHFFETAPEIADIFNINPSWASPIMNGMRVLNQRFITGNLLAPFFAVRSHIYSLQEEVNAVPRLNAYFKQKFGKDVDVKSIDILNERSFAFKEALAKEYAEKSIQDTINKMNYTSKDKTVNIQRIENMKQDLNDFLLTDFEKLGVSTSKPIEFVSKDLRQFTIDNVKDFEWLMNKIQYNLPIGMFRKIGRYINAALNATKSSPNNAAIIAYGKKLGAISEDYKITDRKMLYMINEALQKHTASNETRGAGTNLLGTIGKLHRDWTAYGNVTQQSIASKLFGANKLVEAGKDLSKIVDPNVRIVDVFHNVSKDLSDFEKTGIVQGIYRTAIIPAFLTFMWNNQNQETRDIYDGLSNYDKISGPVFVTPYMNISIRMDQELGIFYNLARIVFENVLGDSDKLHRVNPGYDALSSVNAAVDRSLEVNLPPALKAGINLAGYKIGTGTGSSSIYEAKNIINTNLSETKYVEGALNAGTYEALHSAFGILGDILAVGLDKTASQSEYVPDFSYQVEKSIMKSPLWTNNFTSYNDTSKYVYKSNALIKSMENIDKTVTRNPQQQDAYQFILDYRRNYLTPYYEAITDIKKKLNALNVTANAEISQELDQLTKQGDYVKLLEKAVIGDKRRDLTNEANKRMQVLFGKMYAEYKNLDNLLEQRYGKGINLENVMDKLSGKDFQTGLNNLFRR